MQAFIPEALASVGGWTGRRAEFLWKTVAELSASVLVPRFIVG